MELSLYKKSQLLLEAPAHEPLYRNVAYLNRVMDPKELKLTVKRLAKALKLHSFDAIAVIGHSGMLIGPALAMEMDKSLIMVRKPDVSSHSDYEVEGDYGARSYIFVDDLVSLGGTIRRLRKSIRRVMPNARYLGAAMYTDITNDADVDYYLTSGNPYPLQHKPNSYVFENYGFPEDKPDYVWPKVVWDKYSGWVEETITSVEARFVEPIELKQVDILSFANVLKQWRSKNSEPKVEINWTMPPDRTMRIRKLASPETTGELAAQ